MLGSTTLETAQVLGMCEHLKELAGAFRSVVPWGTEPTPEALNAFFDTNEATDFTGPADRNKMGQRKLLWFLGRLEAQAPGDGFLVGGKLSLADVVLFDLFANSLTPEQCDLPAHRRESFACNARTAAALSKHPKLRAVVANVGDNSNLRSWLATRGKQGF